MTEAAKASFSVVQRDGRWFWCSYSLMKDDELTVPAPPKRRRRKTPERRSE
jgi:hypothetical protein